MNTTDAPEAFALTWTGDLTYDVAPSLSRYEVDTLAALLRALGYTAAADAWIIEHSRTDDEGDAHYVTPAAVLREYLADASDRTPGVELREEEPDVFGAGHIVLYAGHRHRFAMTEHCDRPSDDPDRNVIGWGWQTAERAPGEGWTITATGHADIARIRDMLTATAEWMQSTRQ